MVGLICEPSDVLPSLCVKKTIRVLHLFSALIIRVLDQIWALAICIFSWTLYFYKTWIYIKKSGGAGEIWTPDRRVSPMIGIFTREHWNQRSNGSSRTTPSGGFRRPVAHHISQALSDLSPLEPVAIPGLATAPLHRFYLSTKDK